ncbi:MAG: hypothetical protein IJH95_02075 [Mogibacterium sp.]|nr:hypothetical protein [Mogibacterium sp.]
MTDEKKERKRNIRSVLISIVAAELIAAAALCCAVFSISMARIYEKRSNMVIRELASFDASGISSDMGNIYKQVSEGIAEEKEEDVWTIETVNYRKGPGTQYESAGVLNVYSGIKRTGTTYNDWSRVLVNGKEYYILSEFLSDEAPIITETGQKGEYQKYALSQLANYGWAATEIYPLIKLWNRESGWNPNSHNGSSGAHGIPQALPASKMASEGSDYYTNGNTQIRWGLGYIRSRYGSPSGAWAHFCSSGWY